MIFWRMTSRHLHEARAGWRGRGRGGGGSFPEAGLVGGGREGEAGEKELEADVDVRDSSVGWIVKEC